MEPGVARMQAALLSSEKSIVVVRKDKLSYAVKADIFERMEGISLGHEWQVSKTPPGSENGACIQRVNLGTREDRHLLDRRTGLRSTGIQIGLAWIEQFPARSMSRKGHETKRKPARYREAS